MSNDVAGTSRKSTLENHIILRVGKKQPPPEIDQCFFRSTAKRVEKRVNLGVRIPRDKTWSMENTSYSKSKVVETAARKCPKARRRKTSFEAPNEDWRPDTRIFVSMTASTHSKSRASRSGQRQDSTSMPESRNSEQECCESEQTPKPPSHGALTSTVRLHRNRIHEFTGNGRSLDRFSKRVSF